MSSGLYHWHYDASREQTFDRGYNHRRVRTKWFPSSRRDDSSVPLGALSSSSSSSRALSKYFTPTGSANQSSQLAAQRRRHEAGTRHRRGEYDEYSSAGSCLKFRVGQIRMLELTALSSPRRHHKEWPLALSLRWNIALQ